MKKTIVAIGTLFVLVLSFQNCAQRSLTSAPNGSGLASSNKADNPQVPATDFNKLVMWDNTKQQIVDTNVQTGEMWIYEDYGNTRGNRFCLTSADLQELHTLLQNSSICIPTVDYNKAKDQVCTMNYQFPYASLANEKEEYRLGEKNNGCDEPIDLCGDRGPMLRNFITAILAHLTTKVCP